jgi:cytochrome c553
MRLINYIILLQCLGRYCAATAASVTTPGLRASRIVEVRPRLYIGMPGHTDAELCHACASRRLQSKALQQRRCHLLARQADYILKSLDDFRLAQFRA